MIFRALLGGAVFLGVLSCAGMVGLLFADASYDLRYVNRSGETVMVNDSAWGEHEVRLEPGDEEFVKFGSMPDGRQSYSIRYLESGEKRSGRKPEPNAQGEILIEIPSFGGRANRPEVSGR